MAHPKTRGGYQEAWAFSAQASLAVLCVVMRDCEVGVARWELRYGCRLVIAVHGGEIPGPVGEVVSEWGGTIGMRSRNPRRPPPIARERSYLPTRSPYTVRPTVSRFPSRYAVPIFLNTISRVLPKLAEFCEAKFGRAKEDELDTARN